VADKNLFFSYNIVCLKTMQLKSLFYINYNVSDLLKNNLQLLPRYCVENYYQSNYNYFFVLSNDFFASLLRVRRW